MKRSLLIALSAILTTGAFAASSGTLFLKGDVVSVNDIAITAAGAATALNIVGGESAKNVGSAEETSNNLLGYKIQMSSANAGELRHGTTTAKTTYKISYSGAAAVAPGAAASPVTVKTVAALTGKTTATSQIAIDVVALPTAVTGTYSDTVTLAIVAN